MEVNGTEHIGKRMEPRLDEEENKAKKDLNRKEGTEDHDEE